MLIFWVNFVNFTAHIFNRDYKVQHMAMDNDVDPDVQSESRPMNYNNI